MLAALVAVCSLTAATAEAHNRAAPVAVTLAPTGIAGAVAVLHGTVDAGDQKTTYWFEVGPTTAYGSSTQPATLDRKGVKPVVSVVSGLLKGGTYHARLVARNDDGLSLGADVAFTLGLIPTPGAPAPLPGAESGDDAGAGTSAGDGADDDSDAGEDAGGGPALAPSAPPELGETVAVAPQTGNVLVRLPGSSRSLSLSDAASIPVGSIVDTRKGTVTLRSEVPGVGTQSGTFRGGLFEVRQPVAARGMTELVLRGPMPTCTGGARAAAARTGKRPPRRALWGRDDHGRFRTRGSNSVATVRGTAWYVEDRCDGTLTRVSKGSVAVRDLHRQRTVIVNAGKSYVARSAR